MAHNEISTTLSHSHGRGDNLNPNRDRQEIYGDMAVRELPRRINDCKPRHYHGPSWQDILDAREKSEKKKRNAPIPMSAFNIHTKERTDGKHCNDLASKLGIGESTVWAAHRNGIRAVNWVIVDQCTEVPEELIKKAFESIAALSEYRSLKNAENNSINAVKHYGVNIFTGERLERSSACLLAKAVNSSSSAVSRASAKRFVVKGAWIVWSERHPIKEEDIEWRVKAAISKKDTTEAQSI
jgi:hypothetical protein